MDSASSAFSRLLCRVCLSKSAFCFSKPSNSGSESGFGIQFGEAFGFARRAFIDQVLQAFLLKAHVIQFIRLGVGRAGIGGVGELVAALLGGNFYLRFLQGGRFRVQTQLLFGMDAGEVQCLLSISKRGTCACSLR